MKIVLTGSVAFDYLMTFPGYFKDHILLEHVDTISLSFLVDSMVKQPGGIAPNIAYTLALLGEHPHLFATVGEDFESYREWLEANGVDTRYARVIPGEATASFFVNTDRANSQIASFYPGAMAHAEQLSLKELADDPPDLVVISPNDPGAMEMYVNECREMDFPYVYDPSQQIVRLAPEALTLGITGAHSVFVNEYEFALIQKATGLKLEDILEHVAYLVITEGEKGATIYTADERIHIPSVPPEQIVDPTGVGDAFRGGFLSGVAHNLDLENCGRMGSLAAAYCLEQSGTQGHVYTPAQFVRRFRETFGDESGVSVLVEAEAG